MIVVVFEASFINISIVFMAFALAIALSIGELGVCNITVVVGHLTFASHSSRHEGTFILGLGFALLVSINTLAMELI